MRYRLTAATGHVLDEGEGRAEVLDDVLVVSPAVGQPLRVRPRDVSEVAEPEPYVVRLRLREGPALTLLQLGALRTQLLEQFSRARGEDLTSALLLAGLGRPETFDGAIAGLDAQLRLYDDALVALPVAGEPVQVPYTFVESVDVDASGYRVLVGIGEAEPLVVQRLARRTSEFVDLLRTRTTDARGRTSAFLAALLPGLGPVALRSAADSLRDGLAASRATLDSIDPAVWPSLLTSTTTGDRVEAVRHLVGLGEPWIGFQQRESVQRSAQGVEAWTPPASSGPRDHDRTTGGLGSGMGGMLTAGALRTAPTAGGLTEGFGGQLGSLAALSMLGLTPGLGRGTAPDDPVATSAGAADRTALRAASTDTGALTTSGDDPTVLAFLLVRTSGGVVVEVLNETDHATYVFGPQADLRTLNRALALLRFEVSAITADADPASRYAAAVERLEHLRLLRAAYVGRVVHTGGWAERLDRALHR